MQRLTEVLSSLHPAPHALKGDLPVTRRILSNSIQALLVVLLTIGASRAFAQSPLPLPPTAPSPDGTTGGDPVPIDPSLTIAIAFHLT